MNAKRLWFSLFTLVISMLVIAGLTAKARAQSAPETASGAAAQTGPGFTFQGQLEDNGAPVNGHCDVRAGLWDAATGGAQVGSAQTANDVALVDGRFTITLNANGEFGADAFTGQGRWLQIAVRCPAGSGNYTTLQPRQPLTAAPYAQSLLPGAVISGSVGAPTNAMLSLSNFDANGVGLRIFDTGLDGLFVDRVGRDGVYVGETVDDGFFVCNAGGLQEDCLPSASRNGLEVGLAADNGLLVSHAGTNGIGIVNAASHGIYIGHAGGTISPPIAAGPDGIFICSVGSETGCENDGFSNGVEIGRVPGHGIHVGYANTGVYIDDAYNRGLNVRQSFVGVEIENSLNTGLIVNNAGEDGLWVIGAADNGVLVTQAGRNGVAVGGSTNAFWAYGASADGLYVRSAGYNGVDVTGGNLAGYFGGAVQITGGCTGCTLANFGINTGQTPLERGDVVVLKGSQLSRVDSTPMLLEVAQANGQGAVVGVVMGRAEEVAVENPRPDELGTRLIPREGPAQPGEFVTIATYGLAPVRVGTANTSLTIGQRLTAGENGIARALQTVEVDGVTLNEAAATLGIALEAGDTDGDGLVWVLVNPN